MTWTTSLRLTLTDTGESIEIPSGADWGVSQTLTPIGGAAEVRRSVNGDLIVIENPAFRKYAVEISSSGVEAPAMGGLWPGASVTVESVARLRERVESDGTATLSREPVARSVKAFDASVVSRKWWKLRGGVISG